MRIEFGGTVNRVTEIIAKIFKRNQYFKEERQKILSRTMEILHSLHDLPDREITTRYFFLLIQELQILSSKLIHNADGKLRDLLDAYVFRCKNCDILTPGGYDFIRDGLDDLIEETGRRIGRGRSFSWERSYGGD